MRNVVWTAIIAVMLGVASVILSITLPEYDTTALCLAALSITFALLSNREG